MSKSIQFLSISILITILVVISYRPVLHAPFVFDDKPNISDNRLLYLDSFSPLKLNKLKQTITEKGRPLAMFSFALNYYFGRLDPFGYHLVNLLIHLAAAIVVYFLVNALLLDTPYQDQSFLVAATTALLFASHPVQTQSVSYIVQRMTSMAALFFLLALLVYLRGRLFVGKVRYGCWVLAGVFACCAFASKENTVTLPLFIFLAAFYLKSAEGKKGAYRWLLWLGAAGGILLLALVYTKFDLAKLLAYEKRSFTLGQRLLTQPRVLVHYLSLLFWPLPGRLNLDYDFPLSFSLINPPTTILCILFLLGLLGLSFYLAKKESLISFCIWWFFGNLLIESSIIPLEMVFEHRLYLPSVGVFLLVSLLLAKLWQRFKLKEIMAGLLVLPLTVLLSWGTYQRNLIWSDEVALWEDVVSKSPNEARAHLTLGAAYVDVKRYKEAQDEYKTALKLRPDYAKAHYNLGLSLEREGKWQEATQSYQKALKFKSNYGEAHNNLGGMYLQQGQYEEAEAHFLEALRIKPEFIEIRGNLGAIYLQQGDKERARREFLALLKQKPDVGEAHFNLGIIYLRDKAYPRARQHFLQALRLRPKHISPAAIQNLLNQTQRYLGAKNN